LVNNNQKENWLTTEYHLMPCIISNPPRIGPGGPGQKVPVTSAEI